MKSNKNSELNKDDDLIFKPLNIKDPFRPDNSLFLSPLNASGSSLEPQSSTLDMNYINDKIANIYRANNNPTSYGNWGDYSKLFQDSLNNPKTSNTFPFGNIPTTSTTGPVTGFGGATPGVNTSLVNLGTTAPTNTSPTPNTGTTTSSSGSTTPSSGKTTPSGGSMTPGLGSTTPSSGSMAPSFGTSTPSSGFMTPDSGTTTPSSGSMTPGLGTSTPSSGSMAPGSSFIATPGSFGFTGPGATNVNIRVPNSLNLPPLPLTPYPPSIPLLESEDFNEAEESTSSSDFNNNSISNNDEDLYSYNDPEYSIITTNEINSNSVNAVDILRNFDFSYDYTIDENRNGISSKDIEKIFDEIEKNHPGILATMKAYRIPYPISKVLIKKIIYITAKYNEK